MDSRRRLYTAAFIVYLAFSLYRTVGSESCTSVIGEEQPYCVSIKPLIGTGIPSGVIFSLYRGVIQPLQEARFSFQNDIFTKFYNCLVPPKNIYCTVSFYKTDYPSYNYTADDKNAEQMFNNGAQSFKNYWTCSIPVYPEKDDLINITCRRGVAKPLTPQCDLARICSSIDKTQGSSEKKNLVKVIWTLRFPGDGVPPDDCRRRPLELQYNSGHMTVLPCSADDGKCNSSTNAEVCGERPEGADQSEESSPTALIIGVVCAILVVIVLAVLGAFFLRRKVRNKQHSTATMINGTSPNLAALQSALHTDKNDSGAFPSKDAGSNMPSNASKNNRGLALAYDSFAATSTTRDSVTLNGYATIADTECDSGSPLDSNDNRVKNHNHAPAETSQYSFIDRADAAGNGYSKLGEPVRNFKNPYNVLLKPKEDPRARNPVPIPDESTKQPSRYSLAHPILDGGSSRPIEVVDIVHPAHNPDKTSEKDNAKESESKSTNDYDYPSDEEMPVKQKDPMYSEVEKEEEFAKTTTTGGDTDRPYFELEKVEESDTDYGATHSNQGFDPQE